MAGKFCTGCGNRMEANRHYYGACGRPAASATSPPGAARQSDGTINCPRCGLRDYIQKASAIVSAGTANTSGNVDYRYVTTKSASTLAHYLRLEDAKVGKPDFALWPWVLGVIFLLMDWGFSQPMQSSMSAPPQAAGSLWGGFGLVVVAPMWLYAFYRLIKYGFEAQSSARFNAEEQATHARRMEVWPQVYYCARDDVVFLPGRATSVPPDQILTLVDSVTPGA